MDDHSDSIMVALLPTTTYWCRIKLPHLTLVYAGETKDRKPSDFNSLAKDASIIATLSGPIGLRVTGKDYFGDEDNVEVYTLESTPELEAMRKIVEDWNESEFDFSPHVTIGPVGSYKPMAQAPPEIIFFDKVLLGWGKETLVFNMSKRY